MALIFKILVFSSSPLMRRQTIVPIITLASVLLKVTVISFLDLRAMVP